MQLSRFRVLACAVLPLLLSVSLARAEDSPDLPPPPEGGGMQGDLQNLTAQPEAGADLPPPPGSMNEPTLNAEAPATDPNAIPAEVPPATNDVPLNAESSDAPLVPEDMGLSEVPPVQTTQQKYDSPSKFSSTHEITDLNMGDRMNMKELVLWMNFGPSYSGLNTKGTYTTGAATLPNQGKSGGLGYSGSLGIMLGETMEASFNFIGVPRTTKSTVDQVMFGLGPRFGFITLEALVGVQRGLDVSPNGAGGVNGQTGALLSYGAKASIDIILGHSKDSRVSYGISPEAFYITSQTDDGYTNAGAAVSFKVFGYENAF